MGLLCLQPSISGGGISRIISSVSVYNELLSIHPDAQRIIHRLTQPIYMDTRASGGINFIQVAPIKVIQSDTLNDKTMSTVRTYWHKEYYRSVYSRFPSHTLLQESYSHDVLLKEALDTYDSILEEQYRPTTASSGVPASRLYLDMTLEKGDIQLLSNHLILHARTGYEDQVDGFETKDQSTTNHSPPIKRHLLRFWLSLTDEYSVHHSNYSSFEQVKLIQNRYLEYLSIAKSFIWAKLYS